MATPQRRVTLAFAGPGESTLENTKALLNDFLGFGPEDDDGFPAIPDDADLDLDIYVPATDDHLTDGVEIIREWLDYADLAYNVITDKSTEQSRGVRRLIKNAEQVDSERNVNQALIDALRDAREDGRETSLILLYGEEGDDNAEILLDLASSYEIRVLDLTAGLDDLDFGDESTRAPAPEPEPEPEPEKPSRRRRRAEPLDEEEQRLEDEPTPAPKPAPRATRTRKAAPAKAEEPSLETQVAQARAKVVQDDEESPTDLVLRLCGELAEAIDKIGPDSRQKSVAKTRIEEGMLWALWHIGRMGQPEAWEPAQAPEKPATRRRTTKAAAPATEPESEPEKAAEDPAPSRGRGRPRNDGTPPQPRTPQDRAVMEIWDEDEEEWVPKGRGRAPKGVRTRLIDPKTGEIVTE